MVKTIRIDEVEYIRLAMAMAMATNKYLGGYYVCKL
jgi:hypothetical protein